MQDSTLQYLRLVIVGHVDHGKSTLIGRLFFDTDSLPEEKVQEVRDICEAMGKDMEFAYVMDHLEEERDQGITIDTSQTFFKGNNREYVIIDAPGHTAFTKNMITGASQAEAAILIVDASEGVQEQTRRHAYILSLLGLSQVVVVINKMDQENYARDRFESVKKDTLEFLTKIGIDPTYVIPISAKEGDQIAKPMENMTWYDGPTVLSALDSFKNTLDRSSGSLRMPVQDIYKVKSKRIIAGRVECGTVRADQEIMVLPSRDRSRVVSVEEFGNPEKVEAMSGESTGIVIADPHFIDRGNIITDPSDPPLVTRKIKANLFWMAPNPLKKGDRLPLKLSVQEVICTVEKIVRRVDSSTLEMLEEDASEIQNREVGELELAFDKDMIVDDFNRTPELGRFIIEKDLDTAGGGIITQLEG